MARKIKLCKEKGCSNQATTVGFCRLCYLKNWKKIRTDKKKKAAKHLNKYIDSIMKSNPDRAVKTLRNNLRNDETFERSVDDMVYHDSAHEVITDLGYREDLDVMIETIKVDEDF